MTLAVIRPLVRTYNSMGVPSRVFPKFIRSTLPWLLGSPAAGAPGATWGEPSTPSKTATSPSHVVDFRIGSSPGASFARSHSLARGSGCDSIEEPGSGPAGSARGGLQAVDPDRRGLNSALSAGRS